MFDLEEVVKITNGYLLNDCISKTHIKGITTDTREDCSEKLFIPICGENFDGHDFIKVAFDKGAVASLTEMKLETSYEKERAVIKVKDTLKALGDIAKYWIEKNNIKVIGITGTSGKTTTKELLKHVTNYKGSFKNFNNLIGVPKTILDNNEKYIIVEMGANVKGEIRRLTEITSPEYVIVTNVGFGHIEGFKNIETVEKEKLSIIYDNSDIKFAVIHESLKDSKYLRNLQSFSKKIKTFGEEKKADAQLLKSESTLENGNSIEFTFNGKKFNIKCRLLGKYNALNVLAVFIMSSLLGFNEDEIVERIESFQPVEMRNEIFRSKAGYFIINDCYNANYESFKCAIELLNSLKVKGKKYIVMGDMFELGELSDELHLKLGDTLLDSNIDYVLAYGDKIKLSLKRLNKSKRFVKLFASREELAQFLSSKIGKHDIVLVKASRGMEFEKITGALM